MKMKTCLLATLSLFSLHAHALNIGIEGHVKGDVIALRRDQDIALWCDFNKQIVRGAINYLCVYNGVTTTAADLQD
jgi:hypothetical protein